MPRPTNCGAYYGLPLASVHWHVTKVVHAQQQVLNCFRHALSMFHGHGMLVIQTTMYGNLQVEISKNYSLSDWREDLKSMLRTAGAESKQAIFLFSDTHIKHEAFVEDINNILNSGEVPNMYPVDERMQVSP
jgi:hypothetical protein